MKFETEAEAVAFWSGVAVSLLTGFVLVGMVVIARLALNP